MGGVGVTDLWELILEDEGSQVLLLGMDDLKMRHLAVEWPMYKIKQRRG